METAYIKSDKRYLMVVHTAKDILISLRPKHWVKNLFVFAPLIFSGHFRNYDDVTLNAAGFVVFSLVASSIYLFNDLIDREQDALSEVSKSRPIAAGRISPTSAVIVSVSLLFCGLISAIYLGLDFFFFVVLYVINNGAYTLYLKNRVIADVISIAAGFVIRVLVGAALVQVEASHWLIICTFSLALLLGFGKRRAELLHSRGVKLVSIVYTEGKLDHMISVSAAITLLSYMLYVVSPESIHRFKGNYLIYTVPYVVYGIFRFVAKIQEGKCKDPVHLVYSDKASLLNIFFWGMSIVLILVRAYR
jgi:4-hydroxybenzoate polyprenyltransferase